MLGLTSFLDNKFLRDVIAQLKSKKVGSKAPKNPLTALLVLAIHTADVVTHINYLNKVNLTVTEMALLGGNIFLMAKYEFYVTSFLRSFLFDFFS